MVIVVSRLVRAPTESSVPESLVTGNVELTRQVVVDGLNKPWGLAMLDDGTILYNERAGSLQAFRDGSTTGLIQPTDLDARGEGGLLGLAIDPEFAANDYIYMCYNTTNDVRVVRWKLDTQVLSVSDQTVIIDGMPTAASGRHSGCRVDFGPDNFLWVATGDAAIGTTPQDPTSLGGKILRVNRDGSPALGNLNPPIDTRDYSYAHRNTQGIAFAQDSSYIGISTEHGPDVDDEINTLLPGNFGWNPVPGYNESVPMTDLSAYPDAVEAVWSSGNSTVALSGATFIYGEEWGELNGRLLAATLKDKKILSFAVDDNGSLSDEQILFEGEFGRIRSIVQANDGNIYLATDNGNSRDVITRISPK
jgi:glucose/arabinose dehydrogenase